jgi:arginase
MRQALEYLDPKLTSKESAPFHISFDIDAMDPKFCQATGTKYRGGLTPREACHIVRRTCWERKLVSMDLVEINPMLETTTRKGYRGEEKYVENLSETVGMGLDLI